MICALPQVETEALELEMLGRIPQNRVTNIKRLHIL